MPSSTLIANPITEPGVRVRLDGLEPSRGSKIRSKSEVSIRTSPVFVMHSWACRGTKVQKYKRIRVDIRSGVGG